MSKTDIRPIKTKRAIKVALFQLMDEKPIEKISITELTAKAGICRKTFYLHYHSMEEILEDFNNEQLAIMEKSVAEIEYTSLENFLNKLALIVNSKEIDTEYLKKINRTKEIYLLEHNLTAKWAEIIAKKIAHERPDMEARDLKIYSLFIASTLNTTLTNWFQLDDPSMSLVEATQKAIQLCLNGLKSKF